MMPTEFSRRSFLKLVAVTGAVASGCQPTPRELIPYVIPDENVIPGVPSFYATKCAECSAGCGVVARVREGRVIKLEGNPADPISTGSLCARGQAALQGLYNPDRLPQPKQRGSDGRLVEVSWTAALDTFAKHLHAAGAAGANRVAFIGPATCGPTIDGIVDGWLQAAHSNRRLRYEAIDEEPARAATELCFGRSDLPHYQLDAAEFIVSFGADFVETWRSPVELARQFAQFRVPRKNGATVTRGRSVYVGPRFGLTAASCDEWLAPRPGTEALLALAVLHELVQAGHVAPGIDPAALQRFTDGYDAKTAAERTGIPEAKIRKVAEWFGKAPAAVALAGTRDTATHIVTHVINAATGNLGKTMRFLEGAPPAPGSRREEVAAFVTALGSGAVDIAVVSGSNPMFSTPEFRGALKRVPFVVWCGGVPDETAQMAHLLLPSHHTLENWEDAAPRPGVTVLGQPVMQPVFNSHALGDILLASARASGAATTATSLPWKNTHAAVEATWRDLHGKLADGTTFDAFWQKVREAGGLFQQVNPATVALRPDVLTTPLALPDRNIPPLTLVAFPHIFFYDGRGADKPWLQEMPEPVSQIVWDSWAQVHPDTAKRLGISDNDLLELKSSRGSIEAPVLINAHIRPDVVAVPLGQGHTSYGRYATDRGANAWAVLPTGSLATAVTARRTGAQRALVSPLYTTNMMGRPIVEAINFDDFAHGVKPPPWGLEPPAPYELRTPHVYPNHQWGMTIDLNSCNGCSACVAACYAENNIAFIGKREISRGHIMSWMRIERYVPEKPDAPPLYIMPMLCQQCDHAPCESVCPVAAAYHTEEGLNGQAYNRCIGTRYCNNNCPYKVRRFNWFKPEFPQPLNLQLNPDVTVRGAGVMEKCTFCLQRIRAAEMDAKAEKRKVRDGEIVPACAQACPTKAISFGDMKNPQSAMMQRRTEHELRSYRALEELDTQPGIVYLRDIYRRPEEV